MWRFPYIGGTIMGYHYGAPILRIIVFWSLHGGPPILGDYHVS